MSRAGGTICGAGEAGFSPFFPMPIFFGRRLMVALKEALHWGSVSAQR